MKKKLVYWVNGLLNLGYWDIGPLKQDIWDTRTPSNTALVMFGAKATVCMGTLPIHHYIHKKEWKFSIFRLTVTPRSDIHILGVLWTHLQIGPIWLTMTSPDSGIHGSSLQIGIWVPTRIGPGQGNLAQSSMAFSGDCWGCNGKLPYSHLKLFHRNKHLTDWILLRENGWFSPSEAI